MTTVADLYTQVLGRAPDAGGLAYWESVFGNSVDPAELATFKSVAQVTEPERVAAVAQTATQTPQIPEQPRGGAVKVSPSVAPKTVNDLYQTFYGTPGDAGGLAYWGGADKVVTPKDAASFLLWAGKDPTIANKSTGLTVDQAYETYLGFKPDDTARNYWTGGDPNKALTTAELAAITSEAYGLNPQKGNGLFGSGIGPDVGWVNLRDNLEAAAVVAGNYVLPGSSLLTSNLVTEGAQKALATDVGKIANTAAGITGGIQGNAANYSKLGEAAGLTGPATSSLTAEQLAIANATSDPIAAANALKGWTIADIPYLQSIGASADLISLAQANNANLSSAAGGGPAGGTVTPPPTGTGITNPLTNLTPDQVTTLTKAGINVAGLLAGAGAVKGITGGLTGGAGGGGMLTQQDRSGVFSGSAQYSPEYYQAIQAKYNQMMPQQPRDVTTDLKNWYETKYAPKVA